MPSPHWSHSHRVARKLHTCDMCSRKIEPGEKYLRGVGLNIDDPGVTSWAECAHCEAFRTVCDIRDWCDEGRYSDETFAQMDPRDDREKVWRWLWGNKWRTVSGELSEVPS